MPELEFGVPPLDQDVPCCESALYSGWERCDCWVIELVEPQQPICEGPTPIRRKACMDCAYRMDSVERQRGEEPNPSGDLIFCHWNAPMVARAVHPPTGHVIEYAPGVAYDPVQHGSRYWLVDGRPGEYCAVSGALNRARFAVPVSGNSGESRMEP